MNIIDKIEKKQLKDEKYDFAVGDTVRVLVRVVEGDKQREQAFQGVVLQRRGGGARETFTVRKNQLPASVLSGFFRFTLRTSRK